MNRIHLLLYINNIFKNLLFKTSPQPSPKEREFLEWDFKNILIGICLILLIGACHKEGEGGKASIIATVKHGDNLIPFAQVYIKYNTADFPGDDMDVYEDNELANADGIATFDTLYKGDYYLYAIGFDTIANQSVFGGVYVELKSKEERQVDVLVY